MNNRIVTLINKKTYRAFYAQLIGKGPKYYTVEGINTGNSYKLPISDYVLLEGERQDVIERIREAVRDHDEARQRGLRDREVALYDFRLAWDREHPVPVVPPLEELLKEFQKEGG